MPEIWAGVDIGKEHHHCVVIDADGARLLSRRVPNDETALLELIGDVLASTFQYLSKYAWERVMGWIKRKHRHITWKQLRRRYCDGGWWPTDGQFYLFDPGRMRIIRYRYRGTKIPTPWTAMS